MITLAGQGGVLCDLCFVRRCHNIRMIQIWSLLVQALVPGSRKLGVHKGEAFYRRSDVQDLHTAERWRREGREVKQEVSRTAQGLVAMGLGL